MQWSKKRLILGCIFISVVFIAWKAGLHSCLTIENIKTHAAWLHEQVALYYWRSVLIYIAAFIAVVMSCLPGTALMNIVGGFLFGIVSGVIYIVTAATISATLFFCMVRYVIGSLIQERYKDRLSHFNRKIKESGWVYLLIIRCIPVIPFFMVNLFAGLTQISATTYIWTTFIGVIPSAIIFAYAGQHLTTVTQWKDVFSFPIIIALLLLIVGALVPIIINRYRKIF